MIVSVNYHLWQPCNMRCKFCFATFLDVKNELVPKGHLSKADSLQIVHRLAEAGVQKITFAGGEPTLCSWLDELIISAKKSGMTTMIVTNGSKLSEKWLKNIAPYLDWITLSIDSLNPITQTNLGRVYKRKPFSQEYFEELIALIKLFDIKFKLNTVVTALNYKENLSEFVITVKPQRWKLFQVLPIKGQNDGSVENLLIDENQFNIFVNNHNHLKKAGISLVPEDNNSMTNSYHMIDPAGRFYDNSQGFLRYSKPILEVGIPNALSQISFDKEKFITRGGLYNW